MTPSYVLVFLVACGDRRPEPPVMPASGSAPAPVLDAAPIEPSRIALRAGDRPPRKTTEAISRAQLTELSALELPGLTRNVRELAEGFLDLAYTLAEPPIVVSVTVQPCLRCLPMSLDHWRKETDALRVTIPPDLRERATFEVTGTAIGGSPVIATHQVAFVTGEVPTHDHAVAVYWNDGHNQLRVIAAFAGTAGTRDDLVRVVTREELEQLALAILDRFAQAWATS